MTSLALKPYMKPFLRGHFHQAAFFIALGACVLLMVRTSEFNSVVSALVYSLSLCGLFGVSALYHRINWQERGRVWMRRLDHAFIFILIAGTSTPICLLALSPENGSHILPIIWLAASIGILQSLFLPKAPKWVSAILYISVGWLAAPYLPEFRNSLGLTQVSFLIAGGVIYTLGALVYAFKFPNPSPKYFGYHEIFHILVIVAAAFHFVVVYSLLR